MPIAKFRIREIEDAIRQVGDKLTDNTLKLNFLSYIEVFLNLSQLVLVDGKPQNDNDLESFIMSINLQLKRIQEFLTRFNKEIQQIDNNVHSFLQRIFFKNLLTFNLYNGANENSKTLCVRVLTSLTIYALNKMDL